MQMKREREREQEETKEHSVTTEICIGVHCKGESNTTHKYTLILPVSWKILLHLHWK